MKRIINCSTQMTSLYFKFPIPKIVLNLFCCSIAYNVEVNKQDR